MGEGREVGRRRLLNGKPDGFREVYFQLSPINSLIFSNRRIALGDRTVRENRKCISIQLVYEEPVAALKLLCRFAY